MDRLKRYCILGIVALVSLLIILLPGILTNIQDGKTMDEIHVENVSPSRNALLTSLTLEKRIALLCSSEVKQMALYEWGSGTAAIGGEDGEAMVEYSYIVEETEVFAAAKIELEKMIVDGVLPEAALIDTAKGYESGKRFYIYSEEKEQGAVFLYLERYSKKGDFARYIIDEESGKIISVYLHKENLRKEIDNLAEYGNHYLSYMDWNYDVIIDTDSEQHFMIEGEDFFYYIYLSDDEMIIRPVG